MHPDEFTGKKDDLLFFFHQPSRHGNPHSQAGVTLKVPNKDTSSPKHVCTPLIRNIFPIKGVHFSH